jgi:hypothetical protein
MLDLKTRIIKANVPISFFLSARSDVMSSISRKSEHPQLEDWHVKGQG